MKHKSLEMKYLVSCVTLNLLILANFVFSDELNDSTKYESAELKEQRLQLFEIKSHIYLSCNLTSPPSDSKVIWVKDDQPLSEIKTLEKRVHMSKSKNNYELRVDKATADDSGNYSCVIEGQKNTRIDFQVASKPAVRLNQNTNVVEGEKLHITCLVLGKPAPIVSWRVGNMTYESSADRVILETDPETQIPNTVFIIEDIQLSDRQKYTCIAKAPYSDKIFKEDTTQVRVKDKLAALWPFLGICAEVFVLCAVILVYEKKRNKTELEESDTDQSPDQKNTPDHGKDSDVRHRK